LAGHPATGARSIDSEVWINQRLTDARLLPSIGAYGISLGNHRGGDGGPHTEVFLPSAHWAGILAPGPAQTIQVNLPQEGLGRINDVGGYAAVDMGPYTRRIHACRLLVQRAESGTRFTLEGETGLLEPDSHREILFPREIEARGLYVFKISFVIPDRDLAVYFREAQGLEAMTRYVAAAGPQSSQKT